MTWPKPATLDCSHCGDVAIESPDGLFGEDDGEACMTCGHPGHVNGEESDEEGEDTGHAYWAASDEGRCKVAECEECAERGAS